MWPAIHVSNMLNIDSLLRNIMCVCWTNLLNIAFFFQHQQVIVEDIVSRSVIVQFRAHKSPISALCFDPSGTLLVTASIHGRNINVFRIMPSPHSKPEGSGAKGTCIHLFKLQRGITNAVDIHSHRFAPIFITHAEFQTFNCMRLLLFVSGYTRHQLQWWQ